MLLVRVAIILIILGVIYFPPLVWAGFPTSINCGSGVMASGAHISEVSLGFLGGVSANNQFQTHIGFPQAEKTALETFLNRDHPLAVHPEPASAGHSKLVVSLDRRFRLSWSDGRNQLPTNYHVYLGITSSPQDMKLVGTTSDPFFVLENLEYLQDYFWQVESFDTYGRSTMSDIYSFSIAPGVERLYCAPNPFKAGSEKTVFIFNLTGEGTGKLSVYALPSIDLVFSTQLDNLQDGINTYEYQGTDDNGQVLYNGVYLAILEKRGNGNEESERFKFLVIR